MEPSLVEIGTLTTIAAVCKRVDMSDKLTKALCDHMGISDGGPPRHLATIDEADIVAANTALKVDGQTLKLGLRVAKHAATMVKTQAEV